MITRHGYPPAFDFDAEVKQTCEHINAHLATYRPESAHFQVELWAELSQLAGIVMEQVMLAYQQHVEEMTREGTRANVELLMPFLRGEVQTVHPQAEEP